MASRFALVVVFAACANKQEPAPAPPPPAPAPVPVAASDAAPPPAVSADDDDDDNAPDIEGIAFEFDVIPAKVSRAKAARAVMRITVTNHSTRTVSPVRMGYSFTVDGEDSMQLNLAFGNGGFAGLWAELPPGKTASDDRGGVELFELGTHEIVMSSWDRELARTKVTITN